jgi:DNA polymerase sigma
VHHVAGPSAPGFLEGRNAIKESWHNILARCLRTEAWVDVSSMKVIGNTAVPVIKLKTHLDSDISNLSLDISFGGHGHQGLEASQLNISLMCEYPSLRLIVLVLKQFLSRRGLCEVFTGGLSSYAILLLTARFLQEQLPNVTIDIGASLLGILDFYGNHLQPSVTGISVANMCYFSRNDNNQVLNTIPYSRSAINRRHSLRHDTSSAPTMTNESYRPYKFDPLFIEDPVSISHICTYLAAFCFYHSLLTCIK